MPVKSGGRIRLLFKVYIGDRMCACLHACVRWVRPEMMAEIEAYVCVDK